jgi:LAS superfamily LD-carboxypeptidase LdcB
MKSRWPYTDCTMKPLQIAVIALGAVLLLALGAGGYGGYRYYELSKSYASSTALVAELSERLSVTEEGATNLSEALMSEQGKNQQFEKQIGDLSGTIGKIKKIQETDPELLKKYSKIYFLNENYVPASLSDIDKDYVYDKSRIYQILEQVKPRLEEMIEDAADDDLSLGIVSSYRSFAQQAALKTSYKTTYGAGANAFSADQGYSEHQLGTAVDFTTAKLGAGFSGFASTPEYQWLLKNAYRYGFILSYPKSNAYYQFEPWHWRFVGEELARTLHSDKQNFYDLDQRTIDGYLGILFD